MGLQSLQMIAMSEWVLC